MIDREKVLAVLSRRFPEAAVAQLAGAANAIVGLPDEWEDVSDREEQFGYHYSAHCSDLCYLAQQATAGSSSGFTAGARPGFVDATQRFV